MSTSQDGQTLGPDTFACLLGFGPAELGTLLRLAKLEMARGETELAIETLSVLVDLDPFNRQAFDLLAAAVHAGGDAELAATYDEYSKGLSNEC